jgi:hypothetical protein
MLVLEINTAAINDNLRYLGRGAVVQINQRLAVYSLTQDGKIAAYALHIPGAVSGRCKFLG